MPVISFENVRKVYPLPAGDVVALAGVDIAIEEGEFVLIMGPPSGSGKSTLLNIMGSLDVPTSGEVTIAGNRIGGMDDDDLTLLRRDHIGFVFQQFNLIPLLSIVENVEYPPDPEGSAERHPGTGGGSPQGGRDREDPFHP